MRDASLIADLVRASVDADLIGRVVSEITASMSGTYVRDNIRVYETLRKRNQRKTGGKQTMSAAITPVTVPDNVPDNAAASSLTSFLSSTSVDPLATKQGSKKEVVARRDRGTRLPEDWRMSQIDRAVAIELGMTSAEIDGFEVEFRDFWIAIPGARGRKCDWPATVRNRLREVAKRRRKINAHGSDIKGAFAELRLELGLQGDGGESGPPMRDITPGRP